MRSVLARLAISMAVASLVQAAIVWSLFRHYDLNACAEEIDLSICDQPWLLAPAILFATLGMIVALGDKPHGRQFLLQGLWVATSLAVTVFVLIPKITMPVLAILGGAMVSNIENTSILAKMTLATCVWPAIIQISIAGYRRKFRYQGDISRTTRRPV